MEVIAGIVGTAICGGISYLIKLVHTIDRRLVRVETLLSMEDK